MMKTTLYILLVCYFLVTAISECDCKNTPNNKDNGEDHIEEQILNNTSQIENSPINGVQMPFLNHSYDYLNSGIHGGTMDATGPHFDFEKSTNVSTSLGKTAILNCSVKNIGNNTVSWVRHRDIHLLTVGRFSYTSDQRFAAIHSESSEDWLLKIHYVQHRDSGWYECQISVTPPKSHRVYLSVVEPETVIVGGPEVFINTGSSLSLSCSVKFSPNPPAFIFWYHNDKLVSYDRIHESIHVKTDEGHVSTSSLLVQYAEPEHSGIYKCSPANSKPKTVTVHILAGEKRAAIQHTNNSVTALCPFKMTTLASLSILSLTPVIFN